MAELEMRYYNTKRASTAAILLFLKLKEINTNFYIKPCRIYSATQNIIHLNKYVQWNEKISKNGYNFCTYKCRREK